MRKWSCFFSWFGAISELLPLFIVFYSYKPVIIGLTISTTIALAVLIFREIAVHANKYIKATGVLTLIFASVVGGILTIIYGTIVANNYGKAVVYKIDNAQLSEKDKNIAINAEKSLFERGIISKEEYDKRVQQINSRVINVSSSGPKSFSDWKKEHE